jgi:zinc transport system substrate-binding protein
MSLLKCSPVLKKQSWALVTLLLIGAFLISPFGGCSQEETSKIKVVTGSTLLTYAVQQVAGDKVEIINLIPPSQHPGNFSAKPGDIEHLAQSRFFFLHGWPGEAYAETVVAAADNPGLIVIKVGVDGNWMIPQVQLVHDHGKED